MKLRCFSLAVLSVFLLSCDPGAGPDPGPDPTTPPTPLQVGVDINRSLTHDGTSTVEWFFDITYNGENVGNAATVSVNSTNVPARLAFAWGYELSGSEGADFVPGRNYTIRVTYGGTTYTETVEAPGDITISPDHTQVSWLHGGDHSLIGVDYTYGTGTYQMPGSLGPLTNPHSIPATAYPTAGESYDLYVNVGTLVDGFDTLHGDDSRVWMFDFIEQRFTK